MSLHDELFADAAALLVDVQGTPAALVILPPDAKAGEELRIDAILGAWSAERLERSETPNTQKRSHVQTCTAKCSNKTGAGLLWEPAIGMRVQIGSDERPCQIEEIRGLGTPLYELVLRRSAVVNKQAGGRER